MNPYKVLGVRRNASQKQIDAAWRNKMFKAHPDRGGSNELMAQIALAYKVLSNAEARAHYDATGEIKEPVAPGTESSGQRERLILLFKNVVGEMLASNAPIGSVDIIKHMTDAVEHAIRRDENQLKKLTKVRADIAIMVGRFSNADGTDCLFNDVVAHELQQAELEMKNVQSMIDRAKGDLEVLRRARYKHTRAISSGGRTNNSSPFISIDDIHRAMQKRITEMF